MAARLGVGAWIAPILALAPAGLQAQAGATAVASPLTITHEARAIRPGEAVLITIASTQPLTSLGGQAFGRPLAAFPVDGDARWQALIGIDVEARPATALVTFEARKTDGTVLSATYPLKVTARTFGTRRLTVAPEYVTPPAAALARIEREQKRLAALFTTMTHPPLWQGTFVPPVDGAAAENFGLLSVFNGVPRSRHRGTDFASPLGAPVRAPNAGRVVLAGDLYFTGNTVVLDHGCGLFSLLAHLSRIDVAAGDVVERGATVGEVGATGRATGPHLHWTVRIGAAVIDPLSLLALRKPE